MSTTGGPAADREGLFFDFSALSLGVMRADVAGDELTLTLVEPPSVPEGWLPAGTVVARVRRQGAFWIGDGVIAREPRCGNAEIPTLVRLQFDTPDPRNARWMKLWFSGADEPNFDCRFVPLQEFLPVAYTAFRIASPDAPSELNRAIEKAKQTRPPEPGGRLEALYALLDSDPRAAPCAPLRQLIEVQRRQFDQGLADATAIAGGVIPRESFPGGGGGEVVAAPGSVPNPPTEALRQMRDQVLAGLTAQLARCLKEAGLEVPEKARGR